MAILMNCGVELRPEGNMGIMNITQSAQSTQGYFSILDGGSTRPRLPPCTLHLIELVHGE
jgi:hypothetical protein